MKSELDQIDEWLSDPSFVKWISGENSPEALTWEAYFKEHPEQLELVELAKTSRAINPKPISSNPAISMAALSRLQQSLEDGHLDTQPPKNNPLKKALSIAASIIFLLALIWGISRLLDRYNQVYVQSKDDLQELVLGDGTKVILNSHSSLAYNKKDLRKVTLHGEAYFNVAHKPISKAPFKVMTDDLVVHVLGTEFNVNSQGAYTTVYLDEGKVKLSLEDQDLTHIEMIPGDLVSYSKRQNKILEQRQAHTLEETAWKEKVITFKDAPLSEVIQQVELIYKINLVTDLSLGEDQNFTGGIPVNDLDITLQTLKDVYQLTINKTQEEYHISKTK